MTDMSSKPPFVLVIDDDESFLQVMKFHLDDAGIACESASDGAKGWEKFTKLLPPVVITDLRMPGMSGMDLLRNIKKSNPMTLVVVITAFGDMDTAVAAMKAGAFDFLPKPCSRDMFLLTTRRALEHVQLARENLELKSRGASSGKQLIYASPVMKKVVELADRVAPTDASVLIQGPSGTGKELLARRIHERSARSGGPFVAINCGAIPKDLVESELFGHVKGAFTGASKDRKGRFEQANGGTIFLDEVGELPADLQVRLLRVLQERSVDPVGATQPRPVDVRVLSATNKPLVESMDSGSFREDLYFRLAVFPIELPPLEQRREDIGPLARHFIERYAAGRPLRLTPDAIRALEARKWRGNVRELENVCQRMALLADEDEITAEQVPSHGAVKPSVERLPLTLPAGGLSLVDLERDVIVKALEMNGGNQTKTAKFLRIARHVLQYRMEKYGLRGVGK